MTFFKGIFKHCLRFQVIQSMVWRTGETEKLQTEVIFWKELLGNVCKEQRKVLWRWTRLLSHHNSDHREQFCKILFSSIGTLPTHDAPTPPSTLRDTLGRFVLGNVLLGRNWEGCLPVSLREDIATLGLGWLAQSVERRQVRKVHRS